MKQGTKTQKRSSIGLKIAIIALFLAVSGQVSANYTDKNLLPVALPYDKVISGTTYTFTKALIAPCSTAYETPYSTCTTTAGDGGVQITLFTDNGFANRQPYTGGRDFVGIDHTSGILAWCTYIYTSSNTLFSTPNCNQVSTNYNQQSNILADHTLSVPVNGNLYDSDNTTILIDQYYSFGVNVSPNPYPINFETPITGSVNNPDVIFSGTYESATGYNKILLYIINADTQVGVGTYLIPITGDSGTFTSTITLAQGSYLYAFRYFNSSGYTFGPWYPSETTTLYFSVGDWIIATDCTSLDLGCYVRSALAWAFIPPANTFDNFIDLKETLSAKPPFGYISGVYSVLGDFNDSETPAFTLESVGPINDLIFSPIRTALVWLLYFVFAFMLFKRFRDLQI